MVNIHFLRKFDAKFNTEIRYAQTTNNFKNSFQNILTIYLSYFVTQLLVYPLDVVTTKAVCEVNPYVQNQGHYKKVI